MPTPSIQTLTTDAQQVLNLDSISAVRSVVAVALANANTGTPLNPNLTTQQLWDQFYQVVTRPKSDIESIIANQLMKFLYSPPAPGGAGADKQVIFNDGGVLAGDADFLWNKTTNLLTVTGAATITGDLTVRTDKLFVNATGVGIGNTGPLSVLTISSQVGARLSVRTTDATFGTIAGGTAFDSLNDAGNALVPFGCRGSTVTLGSSAGIGFQIDASGNATWSNVGGVAGTAMTLNSTGLGVGAVPSNYRLYISAAFSSGLNGAYIECGEFNKKSLIVNHTNASVAVNLFEVQKTGTAQFLVDSSGNVGIGGNASVTGIDTGVARLFVVAPNSNTGMAATFIADSVGRGLLVADQGKTNSFGVEIVAGLVKTGGFTSGTSVALFANAVERARLKSTGQLRFVPLAADPAGAEAGDVYYNSSSNKLKCYNGSTWNDLF